MSTPRGKRWLDGLDDEIRHHIEQEIQDNLDRGMSPAGARTAALRKFGNITRVHEDSRAVWTTVWLEQLAQDLRYGARMLRANPLFTAVAIATLALGIGMNTAVFSVVHTVLFRPLPYPSSSRLIWLGDYHEGVQRDIYVTRPDYLDWKSQARSFDAMAAYGDNDLALVSGSEATQERIASVTGGFWNITGAQPALGRIFRMGEPSALVLTWALFQRRFQGDAGVIGRSMTVDGFPFTIVGVLPRDYRFALPQQYIPGDEVRDIDAYIPIPDALMALPSPLKAVIWEEALQHWGPAPYALHVVGRLRSDVSLSQAQAEMQAIYTRVQQEHPDFTRENVILHFESLQGKLAGSARRGLLVLLGAVGFVLLIACANIAALLLARAALRRKEMAIRTALGAGWMRLLRQSLAESVLLALHGGIAGLALANWGLAILKWIGGEAVPRLAETSIDPPVLWFTLAITLATGLLFGLGPAISFRQADLHDGAASAGIGRIRMRGLLVAVEIALAVVLLAGAGLMLKSFWRMNQRPPGFSPEDILVMRITLSGPQYRIWPPKQAYTEELLRRVQSLPGVEAAGIDSGALFTRVRVESIAPGRDVPVSLRGVSPGYLRALGVPLVQGSWPAEGDLFGVVANQTFSRQLEKTNLAGRHLGGSFLNDTIRGVVADFKISQLDAAPQPEIYMPYERHPAHRSMRLLVRTAGRAAAFAPAVRQTVAALDPTQPVYEFQTLEQELASGIVPRRFNLVLLAIFAGSALVLALVGVSGLIAYTVAQRTREIGIRIAMGAPRAGIVRMVLRQGLTLASIGIAAGIGAALLLTRLMGSLLYDVKPHDPMTFAAIAGLLALASAAAIAGPAVRAAQADPLTALRHE